MFPSSDDDVKNIDIDDDENIKNLGELLSNQTSRDIIKILLHNKIHPSAICQKLGIKSNVLTPHLKKMETVNLFEITNEKIIRKGKDHRFFHISPSKIVIVLRKPKKDNVKRFPKKIVKSGIKFASIGLIAFFIWTQTKVTKNSIGDDGGWYLDVNTIDIPFYDDETFFPMLAIILFLIGNMVYDRLRKKRFGH